MRKLAIARFGNAWASIAGFDYGSYRLSAEQVDCDAVKQELGQGNQERPRPLAQFASPHAQPIAGVRNHQLIRVD